MERIFARAMMAAAAITVLDGFDSFSFSLVAPRIIADLGVARAALGAVFASSLAGMIAGALGGGALADRVGGLRVLLGALGLFGVATLAMPFVLGTGTIILDRVIAGVGLGAAAPIAVGLLGRASARAPSDLAITLVWAGLPIGGSLAALFNYLVVPTGGWRSIFVAGGLAPALAVPIAWWALRGGAAVVNATAPKGRVAELFRGESGRATSVTAAMFFFGYITTSIIVNWLPTILAHRRASDLTVSVTFACVNIGGALGTIALGLFSRATGGSRLLMAGWTAAGVTALLAALSGASLVMLCVLAVASATIGAGSQALSVAFANRLHRARGLESTTVGAMVAIGRVGQVVALGLTSVLIGLGVSEAGLLGFAGAAACAAAVLARLAVSGDSGNAGELFQAR